jgi:probable F420-dependent oxidoreductase
MKIDVVLDAPLHGVAEQARRWRAVGADGGFTLEGNRDVFFPLAAAAASGLELYPNVAIAFPRSPMHLAYQAWDLQRASNGRFAVGLGSQIRPHIERRYGATWDRPIRQMRQYVGALRAIFAAFQEGAPLDFHGDYHTLTLLPPTFLPGPLERGAPPIWIGTLGPQMTSLAAEVADGLVVHPFNTERFLRERTVPAVEAGLQKAGGRPRSDFSLAVGVNVCCYRDDEEREAATTRARTTLSFYGSTPSYRPTLEVHGWGDLQPELNALSKQGRWAEMPALVDDEMVTTICVCGTPAEAAATLRARYAGVADRLSLMFTSPTDDGRAEELLASATGA